MLYRLISRARRRLICNAIAAEGARALTVTVALLILLLLLGTDILGWRWLVAMPAATLAAGAYLASRRIPGPYLTARIVDTRLRLADTLSTALFYSNPDAGRRPDDGMRRGQHERALRASQSVRAADAVPFRAPRMLYAAAPLAVVAGSLFVLRYSWRDHLDLRQPMPAIAECLLRLSKVQLLEARERKDPRALPSPAEHDGGEDSAESKGEGNRSADALPHDLQAKAEERDDRGAAPTPANAAAGAQDSNHPQGSADRREEQQQDAEGQEAQQSDSSSSLISKLGDAVRSMLSKLHSESKGRSGGEIREARLGRDPGRQGSRAGQGQDGRPTGKPADGQPGSAQGNQRQGQQGSSAMGSGQNDGAGDPEGKSSAGSEEGDKEAKKAEELAAIGKISVILGKRSENVTGSAAIQTVSGEQRLVTPYADARAAHRYGGADIDRDEVPVALEDYVERYFAAVRRGTPKAALVPVK